MVLMFKALMTSGLKGFLGCPVVLYEVALVRIFENASVRDGVVISTVGGKQVEISEELFASSFEFPVDGLTDLSDVPKDIVFDARSIFSLSCEHMSSSDKKREMKIEFHLLSDILVKTISVKAGSFDAVTRERFLMMDAINGGVKINWSRLLFNIFKDMVTPGSKQAKGYAIQICLLLKNVPHLALGDSKEFPASKILTDKTVHRYITVNDKLEVEDVSRVKKTPVKRAMSRKRSAAVDEPVVKKKRTCVGKASAVTASPSLEAVSIQTVAPISTMPHSAPKRKIQKRKRRLELGSADEIVEEPTAVAVVAIENPVPADADVVDEGISTADDVDNIIEQVIAETAQLETEEEVTLSVDQTLEIRRNQELMRWSIVVQEQTVQTAAVEKKTDDESLSLEEMLLKISEDSVLPSAAGEITKIQFSKGISIKGVDEGDWYNASLPKIPANAKGKAPLKTINSVRGNPSKEIFTLICADFDFLVQKREKIIIEVEQFFNSYSFKNGCPESDSVLCQRGNDSILGSGTGRVVLVYLKEKRVIVVLLLPDPIPTFGPRAGGRPSWSNIGQLSWYNEGMPELVQLRTTRLQSGAVKEETSWEGNQLENKLSANQLKDQLEKNQLSNQLVETSPKFSNQLNAQKREKIEIMRRQFIRVQIDLLCCPHQVHICTVRTCSKSTKPAEALNAKDTKYNYDRTFQKPLQRLYALCPTD
ncbi:hypothetical protein F511_27713 [Dorcoceras hygrometricum]|uniref:Splicing factor 3B subunit 1-like n=1 Tax=Dorcoceras hygrometricum TaxID=472368 RepID=A0A2Z7BXQ6_9LAMI|nr:hypothetical protein F511_27713 [Dorcoceras hygrometricum]